MALLLLASLALATSLTPETGLVVTFWLVGLGLVVGLPTGWRYHVMLHRTLGARGELPHRWWWNPTVHHHKMTDDDRMVVMPWFLAGASGMGLILLGGAIGFTALVRLLL